MLKKILINLIVQNEVKNNKNRYMYLKQSTNNLGSNLKLTFIFLNRGIIKDKNEIIKDR